MFPWASICVKSRENGVQPATSIPVVPILSSITEMILDFSAVAEETGDYRTIPSVTDQDQDPHGS